MKNKKYFLSLALIIFSGCFFVSSEKVQADVNNFQAYALITPDTTPTIRGSIDAADVGTTTITVQVEGGDVKNVTSIDADGNWSYTYTSAMTEGAYDYEAIATKGVNTLTINWTNGLNIDSGNDYDIYWWGSSSSAVEFIDFPEGYLYSALAEGFEVSFDENSKVTKLGGGTFDVGEWYMEKASDSNDKIINKLRFGVPNITLSFSNPVVISFLVGTSYNGQTLHVFSKSDDGEDDGWEPETTCVVSSGNCTFSVSHASYFAVSEYNSLADDEEKAHIDSWKAYRYEDTNKHCSSRLKLIIKGKHFDEDAEVEIGSHNASSVEKRSSKELVAKFCFPKLLENKSDHKRKIYITNPDADTEEADKEINLDEVSFESGEGGDYYSSGNSEGIRNIQKRLHQLGLLDSRYITGIFGSITVDAVKNFQQKNGLPETGFVGPLTQAKL
ncbi:MAG TPA: peptidoglycan-binding protein [Candidatus Moranbacteria bacterium]|nr:peptidoglycan-binding protein [Candidatus Moranbacteria bacterium]